MKSRKWLTYTLGILLTLVVLAVVGGAGFRIGMTQNASFARPSFARDFANMPKPMQENFQGNGNPHTMQQDFRDNGGPQTMQRNPQNRGFDNMGRDRRDGGISFRSPIFGLIHLIVLGLLLWVGYKFVKNSGWRLTRAQASPAPAASETPNVEIEEKKASE